MNNEELGKMLEESQNQCTQRERDYDLLLMSYNGAVDEYEKKLKSQREGYLAEIQIKDEIIDTQDKTIDSLNEAIDMVVAENSALKADLMRNANQARIKNNAARNIPQKKENDGFVFRSYGMGVTSYMVRDGYDVKKVTCPCWDYRIETPWRIAEIMSVDNLSACISESGFFDKIGLTYLPSTEKSTVLSMNDETDYYYDVRYEVNTATGYWYVCFSTIRQIMCDAMLDNFSFYHREKK